MVVKGNVFPATETKKTDFLSFQGGYIDYGYKLLQNI